MRAGLIGLPGCGKTSVFNAVTRSDAPIHAYEAHSDRTYTAVVAVPDPRYDKAVSICQPKKQVPATLEIVDGAARIEAHERGHSFGTDFFAGVRNMDALVLVLRGFVNLLVAPEGGADPVRDAETVLQELVLADLVVLEGRLERLQKAKTSRRQTAVGAGEEEAVRSLKDRLEGSQSLRTAQMTPDEEKYARAFGLVSAKPLILVLNIAEADIGHETPQVLETRTYAQRMGVPLIVLCASLEAEIARMEPAEESEFLEAMGIAESARDALIRVVYSHMGLISFLTVGSDEVRAWTVRKGTTALGAAEKVHTDLARSFIRAEVMDFADFERFGGWDAARAAGKMRLEGKDYIVKDGEIVHIRASRG